MALELENSSARIMRTSLVAACGLSCGMWNLRDQTQASCIGSAVLSTGLPGKSFYLYLQQIFSCKKSCFLHPPPAVKKKEKKSKTSEKKESKESSTVKNSVDSSQKSTPSAREDPAPKKSNSDPPPRKSVEDKSEEGNTATPGPEAKHVATPASRKSSKQVSQPAPAIPPQPPSTAPPRKEVPKTTPSEPKKKPPPPPESGE